MERHRFVNAIVYPDQPSRQSTLRRPVTLVEVFERHPEWRRRCAITIRAKRAGLPVPQFSLLDECMNCHRDFERTRRLRLCPACRPFAKNPKWRRP